MEVEENIEKLKRYLDHLHFFRENVAEGDLTEEQHDTVFRYVSKKIEALLKGMEEEMKA